MKNKKLGIALITLAVFTNAYAKEDSRVYQPKSPWPLVIVEDAVVGTAGVLTLGQTDADPTALHMTIPDAIPGVSYARTKDNESCPSKKSASERKARVKKETQEKRTKKDDQATTKEKPAKVKKGKSCKKSCDSKTQTPKKPRTKNTKDTNGHPAEAVVLPVTVAADIVTLDTQHFTSHTVDSINGDSSTEYAAE